MTDHHRHQISRYLRSHKFKQGEPSLNHVYEAHGASKESPSYNNETETKSKEKSAAQMRHEVESNSTNTCKADVPVMFTSSARSRSTYLNARRKPPTKIVGKATINHLPDELLLYIFSYLDIGALLMASAVCKRWLPLATDNLLWNKIYETYGKSESKSSMPQTAGVVNYKAMCIKQCKARRNKRMKQYLTKISPFTGLPRDTDKALKAGGVYYQLSFIDHNDKEHILNSRETFYHAMSTCVRWYDLDPLPLKSVKAIKVYAVNPLFFTSKGTAIKNSPYQRSLLLDMDMNWNRWLQTTKPLGTDDMVNLFSLPSGLLITTWKGDGGLAFVCLGLHNHKLVERCLHGTVQQLYDMGVHKVIPDDLTTTYGLIGYKCTVEIRTLRNSIWSQQFQSLFCKKESLGYAVFPLIRRDCVVDQVILQKKLDFPWKTDAFRGIVQNVVWLDVTVLDERDEKFWCMSSAVKISGQRLEDNLSFDYTNQDVLVMLLMNERGKIEANMKQTDDGDYFVTSLELKLSLDAINMWFGTHYS